MTVSDWLNMGARRGWRGGHSLISVVSGARFSKASKTFRACKAIFSSFVFNNGEVYTPETSCMKGTSLHL